MSSDGVLFAVGVVAWTLAEYVVHRFVLHGFAPTEHRQHHVNPDDAVLTIFGKYGFCSCITARITVPINCRYHSSCITEAITDLQLEITASAQGCGITYSERCLADGSLQSPRSIIQMEMSSLLTLDAIDRAIGDFLVGLPVQRPPDRKPAGCVISNNLNAARGLAAGHCLTASMHSFGEPHSLIRMF